MSIADKLTLANNNVPKVYDAGNITTYSDDLYLSERTIVGTLDEPISELYVKSDEYSKNLIPYPYYHSTRTEAGITYTVNGDGSITVNGTATDNSSFIILTSSKNVTIMAGTYTLAGCPAGGSTTTYYLSVNGSTFADIGSGVTKTLTTDNKINCTINVKSGTTVSNLVFKPQLELGSIATEYEQYHVMTNPTLTFSTDGNTDRTATILGTFPYGVETPATVCGKNLIPYPYKDHSGTAGGITITINDDGTITANGTASADRTFTIAQYTIQSGTYTLSGTKNGSISTYYMGISGTSCKDVGNGGSVTFDTKKTILIYISIKSGTTVSNVVFKPQLEYGATATEYEPYTTIVNTFDGTTVMSSDIPFKCKTALRKEKLCVNRPYIDTSSITNFSYFFYYGIRLKLLPLLSTKNGVIFSRTFASCTTLISVPQLDISKGQSFVGMFQQCTKLVSVPKLDTSNGRDFTGMFYNCSALTTISLLDISKGTDFTNMFNYCTALQNITFTGTINASISFSSSSALTEASLKSIINALAVKPSSTCQLTLNSASWTLLDSVTAPTGYSTWKEYISTYKGWTYA